MRVQRDERFTTWRLRWVIVLGFYDGMTDGLCQFDHEPDACRFSLLDERIPPDDVNDRLFALARLPAGGGAELIAALSFLGPPTGSVWAPSWTPDGTARWRRAEEILERLESSREPAFAIVRGDDLTSIRAGWWVEDLGRTDDWFEALGVDETTA